VAWNPPEGIDLDEVIEVAEEMGYLPDKSGQEYIDHPVGHVRPFLVRPP